MNRLGVRRSASARRTLVRGVSALVVMLFGFPPAAAAHPLAPARVTLVERGDGTVALRMAIGRGERAADPLRLLAPEGCALTAERVARLGADAIAYRAELRCRSATYPASEVRFAGLGVAQVRVERADGRVVEGLVDATSPSLVIDDAISGADHAIARYAALGARHVLVGWDHLLFLLLILILEPRIRARLVAITAFTLGHAATIVLFGLTGAGLPAAPVEACIALSILVLAVEAGERAATLKPGVVAAFGLLHGLGFARALGEMGLPRAHGAAALFGFNLGVEAGQIAAVSLAAGAIALGRRALPERAGEHTRRAAIHGAGVAAATAFVARLATLGA